MPSFRATVMGSLLALIPGGLQAQPQLQVSFSPYGGAYFAAADLFDGVIRTQTAGDLAFKFGQGTGFVAGGRLAVWPTARIGVELEGAYLGSDVEGEIVALVDGNLVPISGDVDANVFVASLNLMYAFIRPPLVPLSIYVSGGVGLVSRGGDFYDVFDDTSDIAGVAGLGLKYGVAPGIWIRGDVRDYISSYEEEILRVAAVRGGDAKLQNDVLISVGVEFFFTPGS